MTARSHEVGRGAGARPGRSAGDEGAAVDIPPPEDAGELGADKHGDGDGDGGVALSSGLTWSGAVLPEPA
ncbi:hypothetical protein Sviol_49170 [Streptomyces violascens]|uniref:Uncharacterized protein n=1 Tax=Streptomyces violascens TaxID=67381 RepID=A0ABQ3QT90_9ACTN|nr:hypothetical protein Sviol_49170 [Streptomyces violascens]